MLRKLKRAFKNKKQDQSQSLREDQIEYIRAKRNTDFQFNTYIRSPFQKYLVNFLEEDLVILDIGCSGGINKNFVDVFGNKIKAYGFDANVKEIEKLNLENENDKIKYIEGLIDVTGKKDKIEWKENLRTQASTGRDILAKKVAKMKVDEVQSNNFYNLVESSNEIIFIPDYFDKNKIKYVDFIKVDLDGVDELFLESLGDFYTKRHVLAVFTEQMYNNNIRCGQFCKKTSKEPNYLTIGRLMHNFNFRFFDLAFHKYESAIVPSKSIYNMQAQNIHGRLLGGDALYMIDPLEQDYSGAKLSIQKLIKTAILYDMHGKASWAAELVDSRRKDFEKIGVDVTKCLNLITRHILDRDNVKFKPKNKENLHKEYLDSFKKDPTIIYP